MKQPATGRPGMARSFAGLLVATCLAACHGSGAGDASSAASSTNALAALPAPLPMSTAQPGSLPMAPPVTALPAARPVRVGRLPDPREGYAYLDRAYDQQDAVEDAPPDYVFEDEGVRPWVWQTGGEGRVICEPVDGGYRYYYYNPGDRTPYLVRDPDRAYAYNGDVLVGVFTLAGAMMDYGPQSPPALYGARYFDRGRRLWDRAYNGPHQPMNAYVWARQRQELAARRAAWRQQMAANAEWSDWAAAHRSNEQAYWQPVRARHQQAAQAFAGWQQQRFAGPQPQFYAPQPHAPAPQPHHAALTGAAAAGAAGAAVLAAHATMSHSHQPSPPPPGIPHRPFAAQPATQQAMPMPQEGARPGHPHAVAPHPGMMSVPQAPHGLPAHVHPMAPPARPGMAPSARPAITPAMHRPGTHRPTPPVMPHPASHAAHAPAMSARAGRPPAFHAPAPHAAPPQSFHPPAAAPVRAPAPHPPGGHGPEHGHHPG